MLVLSRKLNESIMINGDIQVVVLGVEGDTVKLGINAPKHIDIYRKELFDTIVASNQEAATTAVSLKQFTQLFQSRHDETK